MRSLWVTTIEFNNDVMKMVVLADGEADAFSRARMAARRTSAEYRFIPMSAREIMADAYLVGIERIGLHDLSHEAMYE